LEGKENFSDQRSRRCCEKSKKTSNVEGYSQIEKKNDKVKVKIK
jgi:hypothetical protein